MLCPLCNNMLQKITEANKLKYQCHTCGTDYRAAELDTLIYNDDVKHYSLTKDGRTIWYYPANQKMHKPCEAAKCKEKIVAWENDVEMNKIYGCVCGYSWKEFV